MSTFRLNIQLPLKNPNESLEVDFRSESFPNGSEADAVIFTLRHFADYIEKRKTLGNPVPQSTPEVSQ